jgi:hypothetical protein
MGASSVEFPASQPEIALPNLLRLELERLTGEAWTAPSALLYPTPNMAERALDLVHKRTPDALYFICSAVFAEETVLFSIQRRWPRLYGPAAATGRRLEGPAGAPAPASSLKGIAFRALRGVARRITGMAPLVDLDAAIASTGETFRALAPLPELPVAVRLTAGGVRDPSQAAEIRRRVDAYNAAVSAECEALGFTVVDIVAEMRRRGSEYTYEPDRIHGSLEARRLSAQLAAEALTRALSTADIRRHD